MYLYTDNDIILLFTFHYVGIFHYVDHCQFGSMTFISRVRNMFKCINSSLLYLNLSFCFKLTKKKEFFEGGSMPAS